ncbi:MAG: matrixin family metalloprotease [Nitrosopumilus sp.]|jgi:tetratricopeptide (TPR) repeat protein
MQTPIKFLFYFAIIIISSSYIFANDVFAQTEQDLNELLDDAREHFEKGEYRQAITIYDQILEIKPDSLVTLKMKGITLSNIDQHTKSLKQFFKVLQNNPKDPVALTGMGVGFGNLGEYKESLIYFDKANMEKPNSTVIKNYKKFIENVIMKYPYTPTDKPIDYKKQNIGDVPDWVKDTTNWWTLTKISDQDFLNSLEYMIENNIIKIPENIVFENEKELKMLSWIRNNLSIWSQNASSDDEFFKSTQWLIKNKLININVKKSIEELNYEKWLFDRYLADILKNVINEKRYIEYPNPSQDVIKKFLRDYVKWNFEQQVEMSSSSFPDPTYEIIDDVYIIKYKIFINDQPAGLPLDHVSTLQNTFEYWENEELITNNKNAKIQFEITNSKTNANVWITWVVRNIGEGVLGHAHLGKGVVEVALGDYNCDGSFQLYDIESIKTIMTHEIGHSIGLPHTNDKESIMYPSYTPSYAYCLLD